MLVKKSVVSQQDILSDNLNFILYSKTDCEYSFVIRLCRFRKYYIYKYASFL
jgi:hypothetical protein